MSGYRNDPDDDDRRIAAAEDARDHAESDDWRDDWRDGQDRYELALRGA